MFTAEKRSAVAAWGSRERAGAVAAAAPALELRYRCSGCQAVEHLDEAAAVVCVSCGSRILTKETRKELRVFSTD